MRLIELCNNITRKAEQNLAPNHPMGTRLITPEYSSVVMDVKTYPLIDKDRIFAICWNIDRGHTLHSTMLPSPKSFTYSLHFNPTLRTQLHTHDYIELTYVVEGSFRQKILGKDVVFNKGDLCLIDKNCIHQDILGEGTGTILFLGIANDMFTEVMNENVSKENIISFLQTAIIEQKDLQQYLIFHPHDEARTVLENALKALTNELIINDFASYHIKKGLLLRIFRELSTHYEFALSRQQKRNMQWIIYEEVISYIKRNLASVTIRDLSVNFSFQEDYFNRLIKKYTGLTYSSYIQKCRLDQAENLLSTSDMTIEEIARSVGYNNRGFFYKLFQERYGMTPSAYRKSLK